jgi:hypothetical protein
MRSNRLCDKEVSLLNKLKDENKQLKEKISKLQKIVDRVNENRPEKSKNSYSSKPLSKEIKEIQKKPKIELIQKQAESEYYSEMNPIEA